MAKGATKEEIARGMSGSYLTLDPTLCGGRWALQIAGPNVAARTRMAAERVAELLRCGCDPSDIAVVCSGPQSVGFVRRTLADVAGPGLAEQAQVVDVTVARKLAFDVLSHPRSQQSVGRVFPSSRPRLLAAFEENVVLEDLKTIGMRPKRLREVLKFIYRGWTELADEGEGWLLTVEEHDIVEFIHAELSYLQGVLEPELCNLAVKAVRKVGASELGVARKHVIACEYQNLSRASQLLCNAIASESIVISADAKACAEVCDSYPYAQGVEEFFQVNPGAETLHAPEGAFVKACVGRWDNPWEEIDATADAVGRLVAEGVPAANVAVVCLHPLWHRLMVRALESRGVAASALHAPLVFKNDVRDLNDSCATRVVTALRLLADGADSMAWRCWIGFGDYLAKSNVFVERRQRDQEANPDARFGALACVSAAAEELQPLLESCEGLRGSALVDHLVACLDAGDGSHARRQLAPLFDVPESAGPEQMLDLLEDLQFFRGFSDDDGVRVCSPETASGSAFAHVFVVGFANGLFPERRYFDLTELSIERQERMARRDRRRVRDLRQTAIHELHVGSFARMEQEAARRCGVKQDRIFVAEDGTQYAKVSPSIYTNALCGKP